MTSRGPGPEAVSAVLSSKWTESSASCEHRSLIKPFPPYLHGALSQFHHLEQSDGISAVPVVLSNAVRLAPPSRHHHGFVCRRLPGLLAGRLRAEIKKKTQLETEGTNTLDVIGTLTTGCFPGLPLFFFPFISGSSISLMFKLKPTPSAAPDSLEESLKQQNQFREGFGS